MTEVKPSLMQVCDQVDGVAVIEVDRDRQLGVLLDGGVDDVP